MIGYADVYGLRFRQFVPLDVGGSLTLAALQSGEIDVAVLFTGDRTVIGPDVVFLTDDRGLQPAENLTPVLRQDVLDEFGPDLRRRLDRLTRQLTTADLAGLVRAVDVHREDPADLARWWLPAPTHCRVEHLDVVPGGAFVTSMSDDGVTFGPHLDA